MSQLDSAGDQIFDFHAGTVPLLVSMPHVGTGISGRHRRNALYRRKRCKSADTDWHLPQLYDFLARAWAPPPLRRAMVALCDRPEPARIPTPICIRGRTPPACVRSIPFSRPPLYQAGQVAPDARRKLGTPPEANTGNPITASCSTELDRLLANLPGKVALWDAHSIASHVPRFFQRKTAGPESGHRRRQKLRAGHA